MYVVKRDLSRKAEPDKSSAVEWGHPSFNSHVPSIELASSTENLIPSSLITTCAFSEKLMQRSSR